MPSCPLSPFLTGKANPKIRAVEQRRAWHRTKERPAQLPVKALTCAPQKAPWKCSFHHTGLFGARDTLGKLAPARQEVQSQE